VAAFLFDWRLRCALISAQTGKTAPPGLTFLQKIIRSAKNRAGYEICGLGVNVINPNRKLLLLAV
jgi:hypothetical protein